MSTATTVSLDVCPGIRTFLNAAIPGVTVNILEFGSTTPDKAILVRRLGSFGTEQYNPIDNARIMIVCRDSSAKKATALYNQVRNLFHRKGNYWAGEISVLSSMENAGPNDGKDDTGLPTVDGIYQFQCREV